MRYPAPPGDVGQLTLVAGRGVTAMSELMTLLRNSPGCLQIRTSFEPTNTVAGALYHGLGLRRTGKIDGGETVVDLELTGED